MAPPSLLLSFLQIPVFLAHVLRLVSKLLSHMPPVLFTLLLLCCVWGELFNMLGLRFLTSGSLRV